MDMINDRPMPTAETIVEIFARSRPALESLFRRRWVSEEEAEEILDEALNHLLLQWNRVEDPAPRLLSLADRIIRIRLESLRLLEESLA
jgi:hypothetical protein